MSLRILLAGLLTAGCLAVPAAAVSEQPLVPGPSKTKAYTAKVVVPTTARNRPGGKVVARLGTSAALYGGANVLLVLGSERHNGNVWLKVRLTKRPNDAAGWVRADDVLVHANPYQVKVDISSRQVSIVKSGKVISRSRAVVGAGRTPTPTGMFAISERVPQPRGSKLGSHVVALTAHSNVHKTFDGGDGRVGIHGYERLGNRLGTAASNGCIRIPQSFLRRVVSLPSGTPVRVTR